MTEPIGIAMLGVGNVGAGVSARLTAAAADYAARAGRPLAVRVALVRDPARERPGLSAALLTDDPERVFATPGVDIVVELLGGDEPARTYIERALRAGRHVVTANKGVIAKHGPQLHEIAREHGVQLLFDAAVGGGIPVISPITRDLLANDLTAITAIINGTTNYMLTEMSRTAVSYAEVLGEAQRLGYAEPDPTADVEGHDAAYKLAILCALAFHAPLAPADIACHGITALEERDFRYAQELGYRIKLLAHGALVDGEIVASVGPTLVAADQPLARVDGVLNAIQVEGDLVGRVVLEGPGAGRGPTTSAVLGDVLQVARDIACGRAPLAPPPVRVRRVRPPGEHLARHYLRLTVSDRPAVLAELGALLGERDISIASLIQFETDEDAQTAELVITTHLARADRVADALAACRETPTVHQIGNVLPMIGPAAGGR